jgi:hypothetical protein
MTPEARLAQSYTDAEVAFWHFAPEINVGSDVGDRGYTDMLRTSANPRD